MLQSPRGPLLSLARCFCRHANGNASPNLCRPVARKHERDTLPQIGTARRKGAAQTWRAPGSLLPLVWPRDGPEREISGPHVSTGERRRVSFATCARFRFGSPNVAPRATLRGRAFGLRQRYCGADHRAEMGRLCVFPLKSKPHAAPAHASRARFGLPWGYPSK
jgi:hypothetical protein